MTPADLRLVAAALRAGIKEGTALPELAPKVADAILVGVSPAERQYWRKDFLERAVPKESNGKGAVGKVDPGREAPPIGRPAPLPVEGDAALFQAILLTDFPQLEGQVRCALVLNLPSRFSVGRMGPQVWIRFGKQALEDPIGAVASAAPEAEAMVAGRTNATQIVGR